MHFHFSFSFFFHLIMLMHICVYIAKVFHFHPLYLLLADIYVIYWFFFIGCILSPLYWYILSIICFQLHSYLKCDSNESNNKLQFCNEVTFFFFYSEYLSPPYSKVLLIVNIFPVLFIKITYVVILKFRSKSNNFFFSFFFMFWYCGLFGN